MSAWHSSLACANYSTQKAQSGISDHQASNLQHWAEQPGKNAGHSAFSSQSPRLIALPTGRSNDSKFATSLWGDSNRDHYSGAAVGPGSYGALDHQCLDSKYQAVLHAYCSNDVGLPQSLKASKKVSISELVHRCSFYRHTHAAIACPCDEPLRREYSLCCVVLCTFYRYTGVGIKSEIDRVKHQPLVEIVGDRTPSPGGALKWGVRSGAAYRKQPVGRVLGRLGHTL